VVQHVPFVRHHDSLAQEPVPNAQVAPLVTICNPILYQRLAYQIAQVDTTCTKIMDIMMDIVIIVLGNVRHALEEAILNV